MTLSLAVFAGFFFLGQPLMEHKLLAEFKSPGVAAVAEGGDVSGGAVNLSWQPH